jgi:hypothetical protein
LDFYASHLNNPVLDIGGTVLAKEVLKGRYLAIVLDPGHLGWKGLKVLPLQKGPHPVALV